jgi:hypothetical protein
MIALLLAAHAATAAPADDRMRTVILGITARRGVDDPKLAAALTDVVQGVYATDVRRIVIGRDDITRVLQLEADKQSMGCDSDKCLAEVGQALDAQRIVSGSLDKIGDGYLVTLSEIDAKSLEGVGRAQDRAKLDENALVDVVTRLAKELVQQSGASTMAHGVVGNAGSVEIETDPRGAKITLGGTDMGVTPTKIDNLATGTQKLRLIRDDYEPVDVDVPIYPGGVTKVTAQLRILRAIAESNLAARQTAWRDDNQWHTVGEWTKVGAGVVVGGIGALWLAGAATQKVTANKPRDNIGIAGGLVVAGIGAALIAWGAVDFLNPPAPPVPEWEMERKVTVTPPSGQGASQVRVLQPAVSSSARDH